MDNRNRDLDDDTNSCQKIELNSNMDIEDVMPQDQSNKMVVHHVQPSKMFKGNNNSKKTKNSPLVSPTAKSLESP